MTTEPLIVTTFEARTRAHAGIFMGIVDRVESYHLFYIDEFRERSRTTVEVRPGFTTRARARGWAWRRAEVLTSTRTPTSAVATDQA